MERVLVTGAGGFIGHHLVTYLKKLGYWVRGVDIKLPEFTTVDADEFELLDLRRWHNCLQATRSVDHVYALAADMGGMGFISKNHASILRNNALINIHTLDAARINGVSRYFYTSSACVYPEEFGLETRIVRFHNIYGPYGTYDGGREKAPAAICRKVVKAQNGSSIEIWGDGEQTRSFCYIDDCVEGIYRLMMSEHKTPLNLGQDRMVSINQLAEIIMGIAGKPDITLQHVPGPQGVRGRNSDNTRLREVLGWEPTTSLEEGLTATYHWIERMVSGE
jgi:GDP-D-mannose 3',5'-epimerase